MNNIAIVRILHNTAIIYKVLFIQHHFWSQI